MVYAADTTVTVERSKAEIEKILAGYGATSFAMGWQEGGASVAFTCHARFVRIKLPMPRPDEKRFTHTSSGAPRSSSAAASQWEKGCRARWRALVLLIKGKLEAVEAGIVTFEEEFLAHTLLPSGSTVHETMGEPIAEAYRVGTMRPLMSGLAGTPLALTSGDRDG